MNILLVRQGKKYGPEYVSILSKQILEHEPDARIVTLTDRQDTPGETVPLAYGWPGWWSKMELFSPENTHLRPALYIDLDSFVFGPLSFLDHGNLFTMVRDFNDWVPANSSVMWLPENTDEIWNVFMYGPEGQMQKAGGHGDQKFLGPFAQFLWDHDHITSFKRHGSEGPSGVIMQFHGQPKPKDAKGWATERWNKLAT